jgi:hypothetical protein
VSFASPGGALGSFVLNRSENGALKAGRDVDHMRPLAEDNFGRGLLVKLTSAPETPLRVLVELLTLFGGQTLVDCGRDPFLKLNAIHTSSAP